MPKFDITNNKERIDELRQQKEKDMQIEVLTQKNEALEQNQNLMQKALDDLLLSGGAL